LNETALTCGSLLARGTVGHHAALASVENRAKAAELRAERVASAIANEGGLENLVLASSSLHSSRKESGADDRNSVRSGGRPRLFRLPLVRLGLALEGVKAVLHCHHRAIKAHCDALQGDSLAGPMQQIVLLFFSPGPPAVHPPDYNDGP
jgi:hypothetical protein